MKGLMIGDPCTSRHNILFVALPTIVKEINFSIIMVYGLKFSFREGNRIQHTISQMTYSNVTGQSSPVTIFHNNAQITRIVTFEWIIIFNDEFMMQLFQNIHLVPGAFIWIFDDFHGCNFPFTRWRVPFYLPHFAEVSPPQFFDFWIFISLVFFKRICFHFKVDVLNENSHSNLISQSALATFIFHNNAQITIIGIFEVIWTNHNIWWRVHDAKFLKKLNLIFSACSWIFYHFHFWGFFFWPLHKGMEVFPIPFIFIINKNWVLNFVERRLLSPS